jgi:hypothetical protein
MEITMSYVIKIVGKDFAGYVDYVRVGDEELASRILVPFKEDIRDAVINDYQEAVGCAEVIEQDDNSYAKFVNDPNRRILAFVEEKD